MSRFYYVPIETVKARYTAQLGGQWIPAAFNAVNDRLPLWEFKPVEAPEVHQDIKTGVVLDGIQRGIVSMHQMTEMLRCLEAGNLTSDDAIYLQDLWTPGFEALLYAMHLRGVKPRIYAMCHAQSVDEYDFTWPMRDWMRPLELAWTNALAGLFVGSTIHREQLRAAGVKCPIHVVGLPFHAASVVSQIPTQHRLKQVVFSSRLNNEKNPYFMLEVADAFLLLNPDWRWVVTTSADQFSSEVPGFLQAMQRMEDERYPRRFIAMAGLSKTDYYRTLAASDIQFNSSLQDYVSWTLLEATLAGCDICYPNFRSFPECIPEERLYRPFSVSSAVSLLQRCIAEPLMHTRPVSICSTGLLVEMAIMLRNWQGPEVNVWHQPASYFSGAGLL